MSGDGVYGPNRLKAFIDRQRGSANHEGVVASCFPNWMARGYGKDHAECLSIREELVTYYGN